MTPDYTTTRFRVKTSLYADGRLNGEILESTLPQEDSLLRLAISHQEELARTMGNGSHLETTFEGMAW